MQHIFNKAIYKLQCYSLLLQQKLPKGAISCPPSIKPLNMSSSSFSTYPKNQLPQIPPPQKKPPMSSDPAEPSAAPQPPPLSRYESQKRRDWNTFGQYLKNQRPPVSLSHCNCHHVLEFLKYLDQFGKTKVHLHGCVFFGQPDPPAPCTCPLRQAWGSLDALIGRLRAAYEEHGGPPETNPFGNGAIRVYLREVKDAQAKARGIPYKKKKKKKKTVNLPVKMHDEVLTSDRRIENYGLKVPKFQKMN